MQTAIVVPVHNAKPFVERLLDLLNQTAPHRPVVLVDDASDSDTHKLLTQWLTNRPIVVLHHDRQQLFTRTANRGLRYAYHHWHPEAIVILNTDVDLAQGWLEHLEEILEEDSHIGIAGYSHNLILDPNNQNWRLIDAIQKDFVPGYCLMCRTTCLEEIGVLCESDIDGQIDPCSGPFHGQAHWYSDNGLSWRAVCTGWRAVYSTRPLLFHGNAINGQSWPGGLRWLAEFQLEPLWQPTDTLDFPEGWHD